MTVYQVKGFNGALGTIQFMFTHPPSKEDRQKAMNAWVGNEKRIPAVDEVEAKILTTPAIEVEIIDNPPRRRTK